MERIPGKKNLYHAYCALFFIMICSSLLVPSRLMAADPVEVVVTGAEGDALENVRAALTLPEGLVREGKVSERWIEYFKSQAEEKVRTALEPFGYYDPLILVTLARLSETSYRLSVDIRPGKPVRITGVNVSVRGPGAGEEKLRKLVREFPLHEGDVLLQQKYEEAKGELKSQALSLGYLDADFPEKKILVSKGERSARIELVLDTGRRYQFGETEFAGAPNYPKEFLKRYLSFKQGEIFSYEKIGETQLNLTNSDRFKEVIISPQKEKAHDHEVPLLIQLKESEPKRLRFGVGYGTDTGARVSVKYTDLNMFRHGNELHTALNVSERLQGLGAGYVIPSSKDINSFSALRLDLKREDVSAYTTKSISAEVNRTRSLGKGRLGTVYLQLLEEESTIASQSPKAFLVLPGVRFSQRKYDNLIRPVRGFHYTLEVRGTSTYLGSETGFVQMLADGNLLIPLLWRMSIFTRAQAGYTTAGTNLEDLPASLRFFAGGDNSVRGYRYQSLGPKNEKGEVTGGKHLLVGSIEIDRALFTDWGVAAFYDVGNAFDSLADITLFQGAGIGVRYSSKVGLIKIDIARRIGVDNPGFRIHVGIGVVL